MTAIDNKIEGECPACGQTASFTSDGKKLHGTCGDVIPDTEDMRGNITGAEIERVDEGTVGRTEIVPTGASEGSSFPVTSTGEDEIESINVDDLSKFDGRTALTPEDMREMIKEMGGLARPNEDGGDSVIGITDYGQEIRDFEQEVRNYDGTKRVKTNHHFSIRVINEDGEERDSNLEFAPSKAAQFIDDVETAMLLGVKIPIKKDKNAEGKIPPWTWPDPAKLDRKEFAYKYEKDALAGFMPLADLIRFQIMCRGGFYRPIEHDLVTRILFVGTEGREITDRKGNVIVDEFGRKKIRANPLFILRTESKSGRRGIALIDFAPKKAMQFLDSFESFRALEFRGLPMFKDQKHTGDPEMKPWVWADREQTSNAIEAAKSRGSEIPPKLLRLLPNKAGKDPFLEKWEKTVSDSAVAKSAVKFIHERFGNQAIVKYGELRDEIMKKFPDMNEHVRRFVEESAVSMGIIPDMK